MLLFVVVRIHKGRLQGRIVYGRQARVPDHMGEADVPTTSFLWPLRLWASSGCIVLQGYCK
jgi:hypothetical protein